MNIKPLIEALELIASLDHKKHDKISFWKKIQHNACALVLAQDTLIARQALKEFYKQGDKMPKRKPTKTKKSDNGSKHK